MGSPVSACDHAAVHACMALHLPCLSDVAQSSGPAHRTQTPADGGFSSTAAVFYQSQAKRVYDMGSLLVKLTCSGREKKVGEVCSGELGGEGCTVGCMHADAVRYLGWGCRVLWAMRRVIAYFASQHAPPSPNLTIPLSPSGARVACRSQSATMSSAASQQPWARHARSRLCSAGSEAPALRDTARSMHGQT